MSAENPWSARAEDEIDLVDVWLTIVRYRYLFLAVFALVLVMSIAAAIILPPQYQYSVPLQIGGIRDDGQFHLVESPATLKGAILTAYAPQALQEFAASQPGEHVSGFKIEASTPENGDVVVVSLVRPRAQAALAREILQSVAERAAASENAMLRERVDSLTKLLNAQIAVLQKQIAALEKSRQALAERGNTADKAMTVLVLDNQIAQYSQRLDDLERQRDVGLKADVRFTAPLTAVIESLQPVGLGKAAILALGGVLGIFAALLAVFAAAFLSAARSRSTPAVRNPSAGVVEPERPRAVLRR